MSNNQPKLPSAPQIPSPIATAPPWISLLRDAVQKVLTPERVEKLVQTQVELAEKGDKDARKFVFEQLLGGAQMKGATFVQNNFIGSETPDAPVKSRPGTQGKVSTMARRAALGLPLTQEGDGPEVNLE